MAIEIKKSELTNMVNSGMKAEEIANFYKLPLFTIRKALKAAKLKIKRSQAPKFVLVDEEETTKKDTTKISVEKTIEEDIKENIDSHVDTTSESLPSNEFHETNESDTITETEEIHEEEYEESDSSNEEINEEQVDDVSSTSPEEEEPWF